MKKIFGALLIAVCIGMAMPAQAQIHFGVKGGLNLSKASFSNVKENFKKDNFTGFFIGPMAEFNIPIVGLGVDAALLFAQRGIKVSDADADVEKKTGIDKKKAEVGINVGAGLKLLNHLQVGANYNIPLGDTADIDGGGSYKTKTWQVSVAYIF